MTEQEAIDILDGLTDGDQEQAHGVADDVLCAMVSEDVAAAFKRARQRVGFWYA